MALTILQGRNFRLDDSVNAPRVAIVNQQFARHYWPSQDPIGKRFRLVDKDNAWVQVVGLAQTSKYIFIAEPPTEFVYLPYRQQQPQRMIMLAQSAGDPSTLAGPLREVARGLDGTLPIYGVRTMEALYRDARGQRLRGADHGDRRHGTDGTRPRDRRPLRSGRVCGRRRTREIGIRIAVGADRAAVIRMVLRQGLVLALVGLGVGMVASVGAGKLLQAAFPSGDDQTDIVALLLVIPVVLAVTFLAAMFRLARRRESIQSSRSGTNKGLKRARNLGEDFDRRPKTPVTCNPAGLIDSSRESVLTRQ